MKANQNNIPVLIKNNITDIDDKAEILLYGSRARGEETEESDWDILILTNYPVDIHKEREFRDNLYELELETGEPFSVFVYSKNDWHTRQKISPFYYNVMNEEKKL